MFKFGDDSQSLVLIFVASACEHDKHPKLTAAADARSTFNS